MYSLQVAPVTSQVSNELAPFSEWHFVDLRLYALELYGSEIWTLLAEDSRRLQSFHMSCQRQILGVRWNDHVRNSDVAVQTGLPNITETIIKRRHMLFGHVARLDATTPAHQILKQVIAVKSGY